MLRMCALLILLGCLIFILGIFYRVIVGIIGFVKRVVYPLCYIFSCGPRVGCDFAKYMYARHVNRTLREIFFDGGDLIDLLPSDIKILLIVLLLMGIVGKILANRGPDDPDKYFDYFE